MNTDLALGRAMIVIIAVISELERSLIVERVRAGMRRAKLARRQIGRARLDIDRQQVVIDRRTGMSLTLVARKHSISRASLCRLVKEARNDFHPAVLASGADLPAQVRTIPWVAFLTLYMV